MTAKHPSYDHIQEGEDRAAAACADRLHALRTEAAKPKTSAKPKAAPAAAKPS